MFSRSEFSRHPSFVCVLFNLFQELLSISSMFGFNVRFQSKDHRKEVKLTLILLLLCTRKVEYIKFYHISEILQFCSEPTLVHTLTKSRMCKTFAVQSCYHKVRHHYACSFSKVKLPFILDLDVVSME